MASQEVAKRVSWIPHRDDRVLRARATVNKRASKVAVGITRRQGAETGALERWYASDSDIREDVEILDEVVSFLRRHDSRSITMVDRIIGCPHEEGIDYPQGEACPECPFWAGRDRWAG